MRKSIGRLPRATQHILSLGLNKGDLKWVLINILKEDEETILPTKLERLFKLLDFYKSGFI